MQKEDFDLKKKISKLQKEKCDMEKNMRQLQAQVDALKNLNPQGAQQLINAPKKIAGTYGDGFFEESRILFHSFDLISEIGG